MYTREHLKPVFILFCKIYRYLTGNKRYGCTCMVYDVIFAIKEIYGKPDKVLLQLMMLIVKVK